MLYRQALFDLGEVARCYVAELSRRQRARLAEEILGVYALFEQHGAAELLRAMESAEGEGAYGAEYLRALLASPGAPLTSVPLSSQVALCLPGVPDQATVERGLAIYERFVQVSESLAGVGS